MEFSLTEEQKDLYTNILEFSRNELDADVVEADERGEFSATGWRQCGEHGILGGLLPESYGGLGLDAFSSALVMEALGRGCRDMGLVFSIAAHIYACIVPILKFGSERLKSEYLPRLGSGELVGTHSVTEPEAGSDIFAMTTRARRQGDQYVLDGSKCYATNSPEADLFLVQAVTHPDRGFLGITAFVVDKATQGLSVSRPYKKMGLRTSPIGDVYFDNCVVPETNRLGGEGHGALIFTHSMNWERACLFSAYLGAMERQLEETIAFAKERRQGGRAIKDFQAVNHKIVDMKIRLEASRLLNYKAAWLLDAKPTSGVSADSAMAKAFVSEAAVQSALDAVQVHGGFGIMAEGQVERYLRDAIPSQIFSGTSQIQRNVIAQSLGLKD